MRLPGIQRASSSHGGGSVGEVAGALAGLKHALYALIGFSSAINLLLLVPAIYMLQMYDRVLTSRNVSTLILLTGIMVGLLLLMGILEFVRGRMMVRLSAVIDRRLRGRVFEAVFERAVAGRGEDSGRALTDLGAIRQFLTGRGFFAFFDIPWTPIYICVLALLNPWLGLFAFAATLFLLLLAWINEKTTAPLLAEAGIGAAKAKEYATAQLRNAEAIAAMGMLGGLRDRWFDRQNSYLALQGEGYERAASIGALTRFVRVVVQSGILGLGAWLVLNYQLSPGGMIAGTILLGRALAPMDLAIATWRNFVSARGAYVRLSALLQAHPEKPETLTLPAPKGEITVENLSVAAPGDRGAILKGLSFSVCAGDIVAVVGPSASGKSTLARALLGLWTPLQGSVRLDGADVHSWDKAQLGAFVGYLPQDVELPEGTIAENISRFSASDSQRIIAAAKSAGIHSMVLQFPEGYDTIIGDRSLILSGGQQQRVGLARALYGDPVLLVLDEPNASLDREGEAALISALHAAKSRGCTVFVMTHRLNILEVADKIMALEEGVIKGFGAADKVLRAVPSDSVSLKKGGDRS